MINRQSILQTIFPLLAISCASSQGQQVRDARMEQATAKADATDDAIDAQQKTRKEAIDKNYDASKDQVASANQPGEKASQKLLQVSEDRAQYQSKAVARLDKLAVRINAAQQKVDVLGPRTPTALRGELQTAIEEHRALRQELTHLDSVAPSEWDSTTKRIETRLGSLDSRVDQLNASIEAV